MPPARMPEPMRQATKNPAWAGFFVDRNEPASGGPQRPYGRKPLKADTIRASSRMLGTLTNEEYGHA